MLLVGTAMLTCFARLTRLHSLRGVEVTSFLAAILMASLGWLVVVNRLWRDALPLWLIWTFAVLLRVCQLLTSPTLSDGKYRNIWAGHLCAERRFTSAGLDIIQATPPIASLRKCSPKIKQEDRNTRTS